MAGWFNREINTMADFKGLKMRIPGLGAKVLALAGGTSVLSAGSEIYTNLERGVIDATEWIGPYHDYTMGFHKIAKYYYSPGWHEPGSNLEMMINKRAYDELPADLRMIIDTAAYRANMWVLSEFEAKNNEYLQRIIDESDVELRQFSRAVMDGMRHYTQLMIDDLIADSPVSRQVYDAYNTFAKGISNWNRYSEGAYHALISK
jgi:TRAP-type mannitol/chloroaromatic compound transport system substrate-binding protein